MSKPFALKCQKCGCEDLSIMVDVSITIPSSYFHRLTKRAFRDKRVKLWAANWHKSTFICTKCGHTVRMGD